MAEDLLADLKGGDVVVPAGFAKRFPGHSAQQTIPTKLRLMPTDKALDARGARSRTEEGQGAL